MKKFLAEFKEFISQGNVLDLAVGVIIGAAFKDIVTSLTDNILQPVINLLGAREVAGSIQIGNDPNNLLNYGAFISAVINFVIMAFVIFCIVKIVNKAMTIGKKEEPEEAPTTKTCPFCKSEISIEAVKCAHCASELPEEDEEEKEEEKE